MNKRMLAKELDIQNHGSEFRTIHTENEKDIQCASVRCQTYLNMMLDAPEMLTPR